MRELDRYLSNYEVSNDGKVYSVKTNWRGYGKRELNQSLNSDGYKSVKLTLNGLRKRIAVHKLVAYVHIGPMPKGLQVRHLDGNKFNNSASNLTYGTAVENATDREQHGRTSRGLKHSEKIKQGIYGKRI